MTYKISARERALFRLTIVAAAVLLVLCLLALVVLGIARSTLEDRDQGEQPSTQPPDSEGASAEKTPKVISPCRGKTTTRSRVSAWP